MSLLSYTAIQHLLEQGVVENAVPECVNGASLDIRLGRYIRFESGVDNSQVSLKKREPLSTSKWDLVEQGDYNLRAGEFILASSFEVFNLPLNLAAEYKLKSSMARVGLEHLNAGWCDPGWTGSVLTLELRNLTASHSIKLSYLDRIGQIIFWHTQPVPPEVSYSVQGRYNGDKQVQGVKK